MPLLFLVPTLLSGGFVAGSWFSSKYGFVFWLGLLAIVYFILKKWGVL